MAQEVNNGYRHILPIQIRFNDVDKFGHVNNTVYFQFYDTAKTEYFATVCEDVDWERVAIVVAKIGRLRVTDQGRRPYRSAYAYDEDWQ